MQGKPLEAYKAYQSCIKVPFESAMSVAKTIMARQNSRLSYIAAPYKADAQLVKLCLDRTCHAVITEDYDLLVYSAAIGVTFPIIF